jgi:hypothetical protein
MAGATLERHIRNSAFECLISELKDNIVENIVIFIFEFFREDQIWYTIAIEVRSLAQEVADLGKRLLCERAVSVAEKNQQVPIIIGERLDRSGLRNNKVSFSITIEVSHRYSLVIDAWHIRHERLHLKRSITPP